MGSPNRQAVTVDDVQGRSETRRHWKWALAVCATAALFLFMWPQHERWRQTCDVCAVRCDRTRVSSLFGLVGWRDDSLVDESMLVADGLLDAGHQHRWSTWDSSSHGLLFHEVAHGGQRYGSFAGLYQRAPEFRREVLDRVSRGSLTREQIQRELERGRSDGPYPGKAEVEELIRRFEHPAAPSR